MFENRKLEALRQQVAQLESQETANNAEIDRLNGELEAVEDQKLTILAKTQKSQRLAAEARDKLAAVNVELERANERLVTFGADVECAAQAHFAGLGGDPSISFASGESRTKGLAGAIEAHRNNSK